MTGQTEGVIKFHLEYTPGAAIPWAELRDIDAWRQIMFHLRLIGQDPARYGGYGYGNISRRVVPFDAPPERRAFIISGSQTGDLSRLTAEHYTTVQECHPAENRLIANGPIKPSSESLTHSAVYAVSPAIHWVLHAHSPHIWQAAAALNVPLTAADVLYGTPEMAVEVQRLFANSDVAQRKLFAMGGHEDGVVAFGATGAEAISRLVSCLGEAIALVGE